MLIIALLNRENKVVSYHCSLRHKILPTLKCYKCHNFACEMI